MVTTMPDDRPAGLDEGRPAAALPLAKRIIGYCDPLSVAPGQEVRVFVSCDPAIASYQAELVRFRAAPGRAAEVVPDWQPVPGFTGRYPARHQEIHPGSYAVIPDVTPILAGGEITLALLVQPTYRAPGSQVLASCGDPWAGHGFAVVLDSELRPSLVSGVTPDATVTCLTPLQPGAWAVVLATFGGEDPSQVTAGPLAGAAASWSHAGGSPVALTPPSLTNGPAGTLQESDLILGAVRSPAGPTRLHFTGRLESPMILAGPLGPDEAQALLAAGPASLDESRVRAAWDFSAGIDSWTITDLGPHARHGTLHNLPMRAVRGARWTGEQLDWRQAPEQYAALHFLADALEDCGWDADATWTIPAGTPSGFYAARISGGSAQDFLPLFIRPPSPWETPAPTAAPARAAPAAKILLIAPTATYAAYGNSRFWWENPIQELVQDRLVVIGAEEQYLIAHPELGSSSYDCHLDGTDICYVSRRRPNLNMRPGHVRREGYTSDLDLVAWLDQLGLGYDVVTDEDLHRAGPSLLQRYQVALTGTHPEYMSTRMFDAIALWTAGAGRLMYLGGNGFSMNVNFDAERPWIMENRRVEWWERGEDFQRSEAFNSTDGRRGGYFSVSGRQPAAVTGVESATMGFDHSYPYVLSEAARRPEAAFVFDGVTGGTIGDFGAIGGGVVGQEWDNAAGHQFGPEHLILASSQDHTLVPPLFGAVRPDYHADLVLYLRGSGAVFSVSSMAWCAALSHDNYANEIARITHNVLRRFLDPAPFGTSGDD
jgi:N,N-dimethylformamidase